MKKQKYTIWQNVDLDLDRYGWREGLLETREMNGMETDVSDDILYADMIEQNAEYLNDERANLHIRVPNGLIAYGSLGLWNGRVPGYSDVRGDYISDCLTFQGDYAEFYLDDLGDMRLDDHHHDGTNHITFRAWKADATEPQKDALREKLYDGTATRRDINRYTFRLGDDIAAVYGWTIRQKPVRPARSSVHPRSEGLYHARKTLFCREVYAYPLRSRRSLCLRRLPPRHDPVPSRMFGVLGRKSAQPHLFLSPGRQGGDPLPYAHKFGRHSRDGAETVRLNARSRFPCSGKKQGERKKAMEKQNGTFVRYEDVLDLIDRLERLENERCNKFLANNPDDRQRERDRNIYISAIQSVRSGLNEVRQKCSIKFE